MEDLTGHHVALLVAEKHIATQNNKPHWLCRCTCGNTCIVSASNLKKGHTKSCGCLKSPDLTGQVFGKLTVLGRSDKRQSRGKRTIPLWKCQCQCGAITYKAKDTLTNPALSMCADCAKKYAVEQARKSAGFVGGTQISKIQDMKLTSANSSGCRGVYFEKNTNKWRVRLRFQGKLMNFGSYQRFEDAVEARKQAELEYFGTFLEENNIIKDAEQALYKQGGEWYGMESK